MHMKRHYAKTNVTTLTITNEAVRSTNQNPKIFHENGINARSAVMRLLASGSGFGILWLKKWDEISSQTVREIVSI